MALRFTVLASGSGGNAVLVQDDQFGVLIDAGLDEVWAKRKRRMLPSGALWLLPSPR